MASLAALTVALSVFAAPLQSQFVSGPEPSASSQSVDDRAAAKRAFDAGLEAVARGEYGAAVSEFEQAYRIRPHPVTLFNLALALEKAERLPEAWELFDAVVEELETEDERREVRRHMRTIANQIAIVEIDAQPRHRLCLDGVAMPVGETSNYRLAVEAGPHQLLVDDQELEIEFTAGDRRVLLLDDVDELDELRERRRGPLMPAMLGVTIGSGALALGMGVGAAVSTQEPTRTGLAIGAAGSAGVALAAGIVALVVETRNVKSKKSRAERERERECPGSEVLERRLDFQLAPLLDSAVAEAELPAPTMPVPTRTAELPGLPIAPTRSSAQKRPTNTTPM